MLQDSNPASPLDRPVHTDASPPGPKGWPLLGSLIGFARDPLGFLTACSRQYGDVVAFRTAGQLMLVLTCPREIERVLVKEHQNFPKNEHFWRQVTALFGNGLLTSKGTFWQRQRRLAAPAFAGPMLASYADAMVHESMLTAEGWRAGEVRDVHADMMALSLRIAAKALFGTEVEEDVLVIDDALNNILAELASRVVRPILIPDAVPLPGHVRYRRALCRIDWIVARIINERRTLSAAGHDFLSALMGARDEDGTAMSDRQLRDEVITFLLAGHETTALVLSWTIHLLSRHPEVDRVLATEIGEIVVQRAAAIDDVPRLRFAEHTITESMRLYPPAWAVGREARCDCQIGGFDVRGGTPILISLWVLHRDPRFFDEPEAFRPERWHQGLAQRLPRFAYMPFGGGPRICIGNRFAMIEAVLILTTLVQRFRFVADTNEPVVPIPSMTLRPRGGVRVIIERREISSPYG
ncbi:cytochrome P450 [Methylorubrum extorquens]|uniref:cytochrome P450 n=1 Tax=Methylorubrum extorquens TaxID=408 RepID=UPI00015907BE|nr:cytochrome P450 [Methylorubrum extorquens]ABY29187.1 cytochrome P450 [Methylorubrum extorquens PA1]KQP88961.1 cytochrome P450 [Methylobacterium sp. Leaf119]WIU40529.1 cytochrome P450 [Methylorubrum extorquens]